MYDLKYENNVIFFLSEYNSRQTPACKIMSIKIRKIISKYSIVTLEF